VVSTSWEVKVVSFEVTCDGLEIKKVEWLWERG